MSDMRRLIETVESSTSKTKVDEALPLVGAGLAAGARLAAPYVARAGSAIMKGLKGSPKPPTTPPTPPVVTPAGATPPIPANVNIPAVVRNKPGQPLPGSAPAAAKPPTGAPAPATPTVAKPKIERRPGETPADAIKRAQAEKGATPVKPAEPVTPRPAGEGPAVWRNPRTGEVSSTPPGGGAASNPPVRDPFANPTFKFKDTTGPERAAVGRARSQERQAGEIIPKPLPGKPGSVTKQRRKLISPAALDTQIPPTQGGGGDGGASPSGSTSIGSNKPIDWNKDVIWVDNKPGDDANNSDPTPASQEPASAPVRTEPAAQPAPSTTSNAAPQSSAPVRTEPAAQPAPQPAPQLAKEPAKEPSKTEPSSGAGGGTGGGSGTGSGSGSGSGEGPIDRYQWLKNQGVTGVREHRSTKKLMQEFNRHLNRIQQ